MKKMKPIWWVLIAIAVYFLFIRETEEIIVEPDPNADPTAKQKCGGRKCKAVRRRGFLGFGRQVAKDWCKATTDPRCPCQCLGKCC